MTFLRSWWARLGVVLGTMALTVFVPVAAWASTGPGEVVVEAARRRRGGGLGILVALDCLVVVGVVVIAVLLVMRSRRSGRR